MSVSLSRTTDMVKIAQAALDKPVNVPRIRALPIVPNGVPRPATRIVNVKPPTPVINTADLYKPGGKTRMYIQSDEHGNYSIVKETVDGPVTLTTFSKEAKYVAVLKVLEAFQEVWQDGYTIGENAGLLEGWDEGYTDGRTSFSAAARQAVVQ